MEVQGIPKNAIWRQDMGTFVLSQMRRRVVDELVSVRRCIVSANKENGKWKKPLVGCVLLWRKSEEGMSGGAGVERTPDSILDVSTKAAQSIATAAETGTESKEEVVADTTVQGKSHSSTELEETPSTIEEDSLNTDITQPADKEPITIIKDKVRVATEPAAIAKTSETSEPPMNDSEADASEIVEALPVRGSMLVGDKTVPTYDMETLLGAELASELRASLKLEKGVMRNAIMTSDRSIAAQVWLLKLSGYISG